MALGSSFLLAKAMHQRIPFQIHIRLLEQCNKNCSYCKDDYIVKGQKPADVNKVLKIIDEFAELGTKRFTLFGGEPLLYQDIEAVVCRIKKYNLNCSIITNGSLIDQHQSLLKDIDLLTISFDGSKKCHDAYRGKGAYDEAIHAIEVARSKGVPVQLLCTITRLTDPKLLHLKRVAEYYNCTIDLEQLNPLFNPDGTVILRPEDPGPDKIKNLIDYQLNHNDNRLINSSYVLKKVRDWPKPYEIFRIFKNQDFSEHKIIKCFGGRFSAAVEPNGDLFPCCLIRYDYHPVNIFKIGAKKAWEAMPENQCIGCRSLGYNMVNAIFSLNTRTLLQITGKSFINQFC